MHVMTNFKNTERLTTFSYTGYSIYSTNRFFFFSENGTIRRPLFYYAVIGEESE
jgi:hypothetical protein